MDKEFMSFPKLYRFKDVIAMEKLDGTNGQLLIEGDEFKVGSRTRWITPENDNFGFARWAYANREELTVLLGEGRHYGEWFGMGIQRNYGMNHRAFALFNTTRWAEPFETMLPLTIVPVLYEGPFDTQAFEQVMLDLKVSGSRISPGFMSPEGIVVYDPQSGTGFKKTFEYECRGKGGKRDKDGNVQ